MNIRPDFMQTYQIKKIDFYFEEIFDLYLKCFSTGISAQCVEPISTKKYLRQLTKHKLSFVSLDGNQMTGVILCAPFETVENLPETLQKKTALQKSLYIAELMVDESFRGKGVGKSLINMVTEMAENQQFQHIYIRVWDKNDIALLLYKNAGFVEVAETFQTKLKPDSSEEFIMRKVYLRKSLTNKNR